MKTTHDLIIFYCGKINIIVLLVELIIIFLEVQYMKLIKLFDSHASVKWIKVFNALPFVKNVTNSLNQHVA